MQKQTFQIGKSFIPGILFSACSAVLLLFGALILAAPVSEFTNAADDPDTTDGLSLITSPTVEVTINPEEGGTLNIVKDTLVGMTNSPYGYEVYISTSSDTVNDIYLNGNPQNSATNQKIAATSGTYSTPAVLDITNGATWGYAIAGLDNFDASYSETNPADTAKFAAVPTIGNKQLIHDVPTTVTDDEINVYYGVKMDSALEPGIYKTEILYTVVPRTTRPCGGICYDGNGGTGTMGTQAASPNDEVSLYAPNFSRSGYGFAGWNTAADGTGTMYGPNETVTVPARNGLYLYAQWLAPEQNVTFQTFDQTDSTYANAATGTVIALEDERDGQVYTVAKLADGNWWMTENLRLDPSDANTTIDVTNTNNPDADFVDNIDDNYKGNANATTWQTCTDTSSACFDQVSFGAGNIDRTNTADRTADDQEASWYSYGMMYNWYTATAGNGSFNTTNSDTISGDLCPAGWHLPTGAVGGEFSSLDVAMGGVGSYDDATSEEKEAMSRSWRSYPNNYIYSGIYNGVTAYDRGSWGDYWTATAGGYAGARIVFFGSSMLMPGDGNTGKYLGIPIRCTANASTTYTLSYDANSGSGAPTAQTNTNTHRGYTFTISNTEPTLSGYVFAGWSTNQSATTADYQPGGSITLDELNNTATLYAIWELPRTAKAILGANNNLNFVYDSNTYTVNDTYTDNLGSTTIAAVYDVPVTVNIVYDQYGFVDTDNSTLAQWTEDDTVTSVNFDSSFVDFTPTSTSYWFYNMQYLETISNINNLDTSNVTDMSYMFHFTGFRVPTTFSIDGMDDWDVSNVEDMSGMFFYAGSWATTWNIGDISGWDVSNVKSMWSLFNDAGGSATTWNSIGDLSGWNVSKVENMALMFYGLGVCATTFDLGDLGGWDVSSVQDMTEMFHDAGRNATTWYIGNLGYVDVDHQGWNTSNVTKMTEMFSQTGENAAIWSIGDIGSWDVSSVEDMSYMFYEAGHSATSFNPGDLSSWDVSNVKNMRFMFYEAGYNATTWNIGDISNWIVTNVTNHTDFINLNANSTNASVVNNQPGGWT